MRHSASRRTSSQEDNKCSHRPRTWVGRDPVEIQTPRLRPESRLRNAALGKDARGSCHLQMVESGCRQLGDSFVIISLVITLFLFAFWSQ